MKQLLTKGIVLARTNYQEADRILTILTTDYGKLSVLAKGVRKSKSKMAGGVELFSVSEIGFMRGRGDLATMVSSRLIKHYGTIVQDINRTMLGYELIKLLNKVTEDEPGEDYFELLRITLESLDQAEIEVELIKLWFLAQLLKLAGHTPELYTNIARKPLERNETYAFSYDDMAFSENADGKFGSSHIKILRLAFGNHKPASLHKVQGAENIIRSCLDLTQNILPNHIRT
ncbi:MAG: DNA repair protein RecO [Patescibacteria group bacterium]